MLNIGRQNVPKSGLNDLKSDKSETKKNENLPKKQRQSSPDKTQSASNSDSEEESPRLQDEGDKRFTTRRTRITLNHKNERNRKADESETEDSEKNDLPRLRPIRRPKMEIIESTSESDDEWKAPLVKTRAKEYLVFGIRISDRIYEFRQQGPTSRNELTV